MEFTLADEILNQIIFAMEDQQHDCLVNRRTGELVPGDEASQEEISSSLVPIPRWRPVDGFNLMESFVFKLRNPIFRELLKDTLSSGKGVFKNFKNTLKKNRQVERLWFSFKEREMKLVVFRWYNEQRELAGLEKIGEEPEDSEDLLLSDFSIREGENEHLEAVFKLDKKAFAEIFSGADPDRLDEFYQQKRKAEPNLLDPGSLLLVAETAAKGFAGFVWGVEREDPLSERRFFSIIQLAVVKHYRGLGLAQMMLERIKKEAYARGYEKLSVELTAAALRIQDLFHGLGYKDKAVTLELDLARLERDRG